MSIKSLSRSKPSEYMKLVTIASHGTQREQKEAGVSNDKSRLHQIKVAQGLATNKANNLKFNKIVIQNNQPKPTNQPIKFTPINTPIINLNTLPNFNTNIYGILAASSLTVGNMTVIKPVDKKRKKEKEISKDSDNQVNDKNPASLFVYWEYQFSKSA